MRCLVLIALLAAMAAGCTSSSRSPVVPGVGGNGPQSVVPSLRESADSGPYRLWGEWTWYINADHDRVDVVPRRAARFHLNALKFLEEYCANCLEITSIKNNGDSTIDLTVKIRHPFQNHPEYTGFDVKGIIIFNGSYDI